MPYCIYPSDTAKALAGQKLKSSDNQNAPGSLFEMEPIRVVEDGFVYDDEGFSGPSCSGV